MKRTLRTAIASACIALTAGIAPTPPKPSGPAAPSR